jgi:hypothetical protein
MDGGIAVAEPDSGSFTPNRAGTFHSRRFELSFSLPDGKGWRIDDHRTPWLVATHESTRSRLVVRAWPETGFSTDQGCYEKARSWDPTLPRLDATAPLVDETRTVSKSLDARVVIAAVVALDDATRAPDVASQSSGGSGFAVFAAAPSHKCIVLVYRTDELPSAPSGGRILDRLAKIANVTLESVALDDPFSIHRASPQAESGSGVR